MIPGSLTAQREVERLTAENTALRATVARVEALAEVWSASVEAAREAHRRVNRLRMPDKPEEGREHIGAAHAYENAAEGVRAALAGESGV